MKANPVFLNATEAMDCLRTSERTLRCPPPVIWTPEQIALRKCALRLAHHMHGSVTPEELAWANSPPVQPPPPPPPPPPNAAERWIQTGVDIIGTGLGYLLLWGLGTAAICGANFALCTLAIAAFPQLGELLVLLFGFWTVSTWIRFMHSTISCHNHL